MTGSDELDVEAILEALEAMHAHEASEPGEGLRERKKRQVRQHISNVATAMFLVHGFDNVTVARIAAGCDVSEQTVFNYFPTKEAMLFDRSEAMTNAVAEAVRERGDVSLVNAVERVLAAGIHHGGRWVNLDEARQLNLFRRFCDVATGSPSLSATRFADFMRFIDEVSVALAHRIGAEPTDPEVRLATQVVAGLTQVRLQSTFHHVKHATSLAALDDVVRRDLHRAAQLAEPTLTAFDNMREAAN